MKRTSRTGFTLLEMLVVIATMGVVVTLALSAFYAMNDSWRGLSSQTRLDQQAEQVFDALRSDLDGLVPPALSGVPLKGVDKTIAEPQQGVAAPTRQDDEVTFPSLQPTADGARLAGLVSYYVNHEDDSATPEDESNTLRRRQADLAGNFKEAAPVTPADVVWFNLEYASADGTWAAEWSQPSLPKAVRVSLTLLDPDTGEQVIREAILPVHVS